MRLRQARLLCSTNHYSLQKRRRKRRRRRRTHKGCRDHVRERIRRRRRETKEVERSICRRGWGRGLRGGIAKGQRKKGVAGGERRERERDHDLHHLLKSCQFTHILTLFLLILIYILIDWLTTHLILCTGFGGNVQYSMRLSTHLVLCLFTFPSQVFQRGFPFDALRKRKGDEGREGRKEDI